MKAPRTRVGVLRGIGIIEMGVPFWAYACRVGVGWRRRNCGSVFLVGGDQ